MKKKRLVWAGALTAAVAGGVIGTQSVNTVEETPSSPPNVSQLQPSSRLEPDLSAIQEPKHRLNLTRPPEKLNARESNHAIGDLHKELAAIRDQLTTLVAVQASMRHELDNLHWSESPETPSDPAPESPDNVEQGMRQQEVFLEERLEQEEIDSEWAQETLARLDEGLEHEELFGVNLINATCGSSLCQVDFAIDQDVPIDEAMRRLSVHRPWNGPTFVTASADGQPKIFFAREGHELPQPAEEMDVF